MISCLVNYIGLEGVTPKPTSGRYVNELPGLDTSQFELIQKEEEYDVETAWSKIEHRTIKKFESQINKWAVRFYANHSYLDTVVTGQYDKNKSIDQGATYAGWFFDGFNSFYQNMSLEVQWVELYSETDVETRIRIFNASTGDLIDQIPTTLKAGQSNRIILNKSYPLWKYPNLFIAYDEEEVQTINADDLNFGYAVSVTRKRISKLSEILAPNLKGVGNAGQGLILNYNVNCSLDNYVCQRLSLFEEPYMYALGMEFCNERIYSDRVSRFTLLDRDDARELRDELKAEYESSLEAVLKNLKIDYSNDFCFQCDREVNHNILLP